MSAPVTVVLLGEPIAWARTRPGRQSNGSGGFAITPKKQRNNAAALQFAASEAMAGREPFDCAVRIDLSAEFRIPASWSKKKQLQARAGMIRPAKKPDLSNIAKQIEDSFNHIIYRDDALIVEYGTLRKVYSNQPKIVATISPIAAAVERETLPPRIARPELDDTMLPDVAL